ncbi:hypothetical protein M408DRAFT_323693 [Serendipita vermifera MAFF 305830]|uniref:Uncharacterized protein n=1 Tax=Serendipita vermifera MAFF 305830 TaxID=933852 RepID=A0A0C3AQS4_SERVB|nr:hypothetical protein M408DRAFT_323693 [Serendipita vermifera MAFF 305830]
MNQDNQRSLANIIRSCLSTIFLCTWIAVHPNIHFRPEKLKQPWSEKWLWDPLHELFTYKLPLFFWALIVPEYILSWAIRQYIQAGKFSKQVEGWTRTHGFFLIMGGFHLFRLPEGAPSIPLPIESSKPCEVVIPSGTNPGKDAIPVCPLKLDDLSTDVFGFIAPTEGELKDRGKSDALTKTIVLVQTLWFVIQCIARGIRQLPLTELEVVTLAYAMLNFFIYIFWWDKPKGAERPIRVYKPFGASHEESGKPLREWPENRVWRWAQTVFEYTIGVQDDYVKLSQRRSVPMFWSGRLGYDAAHDILFATVLGAGFGAMHCIAWSSDFPSRAELVLWRVACVAMIAIPAMVTMGVGLTNLSLVNERYFGWLMIIAEIIVVLLVLSAWLYIASRITTLVIALTTLRSLPPAAFTNVDWTTFFPHI